MELYDVMRTTFAARDFTDDEVPDSVLYRVLDHARYAPSGGNRQGWKVIVVRQAEIKKRLGELCIPALRIAVSQLRAGEVYWQSVEPTSVDVEAAAANADLPLIVPLFAHLDQVPAVLVIAVDLRQVASMDKNLDRVGVVSGASIYPLAWNVLLGLRNEGFGGALTTLVASAEPAAQKLLGLEPYEAVAAMLLVGRPVKQLTKLKRQPVESFAFLDRADGPPLTG
jgi:nitroreductase